jgi:hypothetical protein
MTFDVGVDTFCTTLTCFGSMDVSIRDALDGADEDMELCGVAGVVDTCNMGAFAESTGWAF